MKNKLCIRFRKMSLCENLFGKVYDFFLVLEIRRSNTFKAVGRRIEYLKNKRIIKK